MKKFDYQNNFNKSHYDHFNLMLPKGDKERLKQLAKESGKSLNAFITEAIEHFINCTNKG